MPEEPHKFDVILTVVTIPLLPALLQGLRAVRLMRLARAARLLRLVRVAQISRRLFSAKGLAWAGVTAALVIVVAAEAFVAVESEQGLNAWDGVWWAFTTATTVGYGDVYPTTTTGRAIAILLMVVGIGFVALLTGAIAERFAVSTGRESAPPNPPAGSFETLAQELAEIRAQLARIEARLGPGEAPGSRAPHTEGAPSGTDE